MMRQLPGTIRLSIQALVILSLAAPAPEPVRADPVAGTGTGQGAPLSVDISVADSRFRPVVHYAEGELRTFLSAEGFETRFMTDSPTQVCGRIEMIIDPAASNFPPAAAAEGFRLMGAKDGTLKMLAADGSGLLWAVRDFQHYYGRDWLRGLRSGTALAVNVSSAPTLQTRGLWTWLYGCKDVFAYIDRASEWKLNTIIFWNRGAPMNADRLNEYAHERGVKIWWGFSFGWVATDFADASPALAARLNALYAAQKARIGPKLANLCPWEPETPQALMDFVLDVYERQYAWIPGIDGIYFQTATESLCPCERCRRTPLGEGVVRTVLPIIQELHRRHPELKISAGIHNKGTQFAALRQFPEYVNICWEAGTTWAPTMEDFRTQMTYRGPGENFAGIYRITMNCGMDVLGLTYRGERDRVWLQRVEPLWKYIEEGAMPASGKTWPVVVDGREVGYPCASDWRPPDGQRLLDNKNFRTLLEWSGELAKGPPQTKGIFSLVEAGLIDLKMRRVPAMVAETLWNPLADPRELERRCRMIWEGSVGGWPSSPNPYWGLSDGGGRTAVPRKGDAPTLDELGNVYEKDPVSKGR